jgi:hypothetical protein
MEERTNDGLLDFPEPQTYGIALDVAGAAQFAFDDARPGRSPPLVFFGIGHRHELAQGFGRSRPARARSRERRAQRRHVPFLGLA